MKKLFELGAICIWWNIWQSHGSHGPCLHYPIFVSSAPCSPAEPPHGGAFCPRGFSDRGQYVPKVRSRGKAARTPLLQWLFNQTLHSGSERGERYKVALITHLFIAGKGEQRGSETERGERSERWRWEISSWRVGRPSGEKKKGGEERRCWRRERRGETNEKDENKKILWEIRRTNKRFQLLVFLHSLWNTSKILIIVNGSMRGTSTGAVHHSFMVILHDNSPPVCEACV